MAIDGSSYRRACQTARENAVASSRIAAALDVTEDRHTRFGAAWQAEFPEIVVNLEKQAAGAARMRAFRHHDDARDLPALVILANHVQEPAGVERLLGKQNRLGPAPHRDLERDEAAVAPHDLDEEQAIERAGGVADAVDRLECGVARGIESDRS